jgi:hypothetical protein
MGYTSVDFGPSIAFLGAAMVKVNAESFESIAR